MTNADLPELVDLGYTAEVTYHRSRDRCSGVAQSSKLRARRRGGRRPRSTSGCCWQTRGTCRARRTPTRRPSTPATPTWHRGPQLNLGMLLADQGDVQGAKDAYQKAIDSGHADTAPKAAFNLGLLLEEPGGRAGRQGRLPEGHRLRPRRHGAEGRAQPRVAAGRAGGRAGREGRLPEGHRLRARRHGAEGRGQPRGAAGRRRGTCRAPRTPTRRPSTPGTPT